MKAANYAAECWANGKTRAEIQAEIDRIKSMWSMGLNYEFPGSAHFQYCKEMRLRELLEEPTP